MEKCAFILIDHSMVASIATCCGNVKLETICCFKLMEKCAFISIDHSMVASVVTCYDNV